MNELSRNTGQLAKRGPKQRTGPRKGSLTHWLNSFEIGETRWKEADTSRPHWKTNPPPSQCSGRYGEMQFESLSYCAVPQSSKTIEPVWIWRITRIA